MPFEPNSIIQTDTLLALERMPSEYVDLIYIDPPWPKGNPAFTPLSAEEYHTYLFKVIQQSHRILKNTGNIFFYSDPDLNVDFHLSLREVFGSKYFESEFIIPKRSMSASRIGNQHHTLLLYKKTDKSYLNGKVRKLNKQELKQYYPYSDERGIYRTLSLIRPGEYEVKRFQWKDITPAPGYYWQFSRERLDAFDQEGLLVAVKDSTISPYRLKQYLTPDGEYISVGSVWNDIPAWRPSKEFPAGQSVELFDRVLNIGSNPGDLVVDLFCGSGSLPIAALAAERKFIAFDSSQQAVETTIHRLHEIDKTIPLIFESEIQKLSIVWNQYKSYQYSDENSLIELIIKGESEGMEFKESLKWNNFSNQPDENTTMSVMRAIAAFLNSANGGTILIGVKDDKTLVGLEKDFECIDKKRKNQDGYRLFLATKLRSLFGPLVIGKFSLEFYNINSKDVCKIDIRPSNEPFFLEGRYIIRNNNQSLELTTEEFYNRFKSVIA